MGSSIGKYAPAPESHESTEGPSLQGLADIQEVLLSSLFGSVMRISISDPCHANCR